jgi:hypothetical protein
LQLNVSQQIPQGLLLWSLALARQLALEYITWRGAGKSMQMKPDFVPSS